MILGGVLGEACLCIVLRERALKVTCMSEEKSGLDGRKGESAKDGFSMHCTFMEGISVLREACLYCAKEGRSGMDECVC